MSAPPPGSHVKRTSEMLEQHLRNELEEGNITWNDFERTKRFFSVDHSSYPIATAASISGLTLAYGRWYRKPAWSWLNLAAIMPLVFVVGIFPGIGLQFVAARRFHKGLEDERGVLKSLEKFQRFPMDSPAGGDGERVARDAFEPADRAEKSIGDQRGQESYAQKQDRWAELRKASASASNSTWDKIRQSHELPGASSPQPASRASGSEEPRVYDKQTEQAKFDALLEAERKMSS